MENWGLVTYKESLLLFNESIHRYQRKTGIVNTIAHEVKLICLLLRLFALYFFSSSVRPSVVWKFSFAEMVEFPLVE